MKNPKILKSSYQNTIPTLSIVTMIDISQHQSLKVFGYIKKTRATILIDSGISHNFINSGVEKQLNMFVYPTFGFQVANRGIQTIACQGNFHKVEFYINDWKLKSPMSAMDIGVVDVVLEA